MIAFPNCKINLGLNVTRKRQDGYHEIQTVFYPLPLVDVLEIIRNDTPKIVNSEHSRNTGAEFTTTGLPINGFAEKNLCVQAYQLLQRDFPAFPPVGIYLHKAIPIGAGLGGGSADGAFTLKLLNEIFQLNISSEKLLDYSLQLGSDCPFFISNRPSYATGRGEFLQTIELDLSMYSFVVVHPGIHISTPWAFSQLSPSLPEKSIYDVIKQPLDTWRNALVNDFEPAIYKHYPELSSIKEQLYEAGAIYAALSGSGSCFYGIFNKNEIPDFSFPDPYQVLPIK